MPTLYTYQAVDETAFGWFAPLVAARAESSPGSLFHRPARKASRTHSFNRGRVHVHLEAADGVTLRPSTGCDR